LKTLLSVSRSDSGPGRGGTRKFGDEMATGDRRLRADRGVQKMDWIGSTIKLAGTQVLCLPLAQVRLVGVCSLPGFEFSDG
jgi:hypothetical protein